MTNECKHGSLKRQCLICELEAEIANFETKVNEQAAVISMLALRVANRDKLINNVVDMLDELRLPHSICDYCWYSCPKSEDGCCNDGGGTECNCGADEHNSIIDKLIKQAREVVK